MFGVDDVLTGGLSLLGGFANNMFAGKRQDDAQQFNAQQAAASRAFTLEMDSTKYQRAATDMQAAGLNRILAAGSPGSTGGSAMAASSPGAPVHDMLGPGVNTAMQHSRLKEEIKNMKETNANINADTRLKGAGEFKNYMDAHKASAETGLVQDQNKIIVENLSKAQREAAEERIHIDQLNNPAYKILRQTGNIGKEVERASSAVGNLPALINAGKKENKGFMSDRWP